jgi:hypothetical protein
MIDWSVLRSGQRGLAVEGKTDKDIVEAFLDAGQPAHWDDWTNKLRVEIVGNSTKVIEELQLQNRSVWGLIDQDAHTDSELTGLKQQYPQLTILPRWTIENYFINPDDMTNFLPAAQKTPKLLTQIASIIEQNRPNWIYHGALWKVMYENGAMHFCGRNRYPMPLFYAPITSESQIHQQLHQWYKQLDPSGIIGNYRSRLKDFQQYPENDYNVHIHGKRFFHAVVASQALQTAFGQQREADEWLRELYENATICPQDLVPLFQQILN